MKKYYITPAVNIYHTLPTNVLAASPSGEESKEPGGGYAREEEPIFFDELMYDLWK